MRDMAINIFHFIKENLQITDVMQFYGVDIKRTNKALCPLHNEQSPSFTVYPNNNSWHCFGCKAGGSAIHFVMAYYGLNALEAAKKLDLDFNLDSFDTIPSPNEVKRLSEKRILNQTYEKLAENFNAYICKAYTTLCDYLHLLRDWENAYAPKSQEEIEKSLNPLFIEACHQLEYTEQLTKTLYPLVADCDSRCEN